MFVFHRGSYQISYKQENYQKNIPNRLLLFDEGAGNFAQDNLCMVLAKKMITWNFENYLVSLFEDCNKINTKI